MQRMLFAMATAGFLASCSTLQPTASVSDDVYYLPSTAPVATTTPVKNDAARNEPASADDYYDPGTSEAIGTTRSYYDLTYNDPYYYNMGRFGFNAAPMGWQTGWNGPGWGGGMNMGWGSGWGSGWNLSLGYGTGMYSGWYRYGWGYDPWGWNSPWGWYSPYGCSPWGWNGWSYGHGHYHSPWGNCYGGYVPVIIGDGTSFRNTVVQHRNSVGSRTGTATSSGVRRATRNPVGLAPAPERRGTAAPSVRQERSSLSPIGTTTPSRERGTSLQRDRSTREGAPTRGVERSAPSRNPGFGGSDGGSRSSPSRGGGNSGGGGGGSRTSPGRR